MAGAAVAEAGGGAVFPVVVTEWVPSATADTTAVEARVTPVPNPTVQAGRVPYLTAAVNLRINGPKNEVTPKATAQNGREIDRKAVPNARVTGKKNRASGRKRAVNARKKVPTADRNGVKIMMATI